jgi:alkylresorcinol/alkylpyrone synthase
MPFLAAISTIDFPSKARQEQVKQYAKELFEPGFPQVQRMIGAFDNTEIQTRNFCMALEDYATLGGFGQQNDRYAAIALKYSIQAIEECLLSADIAKEEITDIIFISTTGLATPSLDALIVNELKLSPYINRTPVFGLGCAGGVAGYAKAQMAARANPDAVVLLVAVELCSLTFLRDDFSKSNFIATSLFSDGVAACIVKGDNYTVRPRKEIRFVQAQSKLHYDTLDIMGWDFRDEGFKVLFSHSIPTFIQEHVLADVAYFLRKNQLELGDIQNFIFHPGGKKVLSAYADALGVEGDFLKNTREVMQVNGNMSSATVLYVLEKFFREGFRDGYGLMVSLGPGFSCEMALLDMKNN